MSKKDLVESLEFFRAERPDEWIMDDFISQAKEKNKSIYELEAKLKEAVDGLVNITSVNVTNTEEGNTIQRWATETLKSIRAG